MADLLMRRGAEISSCGKYRYRLSRHWGNGPEATFIMLNPSTADADIDDATIRKCIGFAQRWGCGGFYVGNLFAFRATNPADMMKALDPMGPDNASHLKWMCEWAKVGSGPVVCAWGANPKARMQASFFLTLLRVLEIQPLCLRRTPKTGAPEHPLYVPYDAELQPYEFSP